MQLNIVSQSLHHLHKRIVQNTVRFLDDAVHVGLCGLDLLDHRCLCSSFLILFLTILILILFSISCTKQITYCTMKHVFFQRKESVRPLYKIAKLNFKVILGGRRFFRPSLLSCFYIPES